MKTPLTIGATIFLSFWLTAAGAQEKVIVSHTTRGSLSIGPLLYGIERGSTATKVSICYMYRFAPIWA